MLHNLNNIFNISYFDYFQLNISRIILAPNKMALQLLKRNYTMQGYEVPKILKLPQGEMRWAPRRLPVDIGDVMMNIRMDDSKHKYIGEHISKYAQGLNPYGEWGYPYKVNKNNIRPPIIDPKYYEPLSRMPVKFDAITAGPIVKDLYGKRTEIAKVAPHTIIDKVCPDAAPRPSVRGDNYTDNSYHEGSIDLHLKQPHASIPYHPSIPVHQNTGVPEVELQGKMIVRPQMGIHFPFHVSDQSRDVNNMRTPMHVALRPGYKDPYTTIQPTPEDLTGINESLQHVAAGSGYAPGYTLEPEINTNIPLEPGIQTAAQSNIVDPVPTIDNLTRDGYEFTPKVQTSAWYNPSYNLTNLSGYSIGNVDQTCPKVQTAAQTHPTMQLVDMTDRQMSERIDPMIVDNPIITSMKAPSNYRMIDHGGHDVPITTRPALHAARTTNVSSKLLQDGALGDVTLPDTIHAGQFEGKACVPSIQEHQEFKRARETNKKEYFFIENRKFGEAIPGSHVLVDSEGLGNHTQSFTPNAQVTGVRSRLQLQAPRVDRTGMQQAERVIPVGTGRFIHNTF